MAVGASEEKETQAKNVHGVYYDKVVDGEVVPDTLKKYMATTKADVTDMICEGGIDGLVTKEYTYDLANSSEGDFGYAGVTATDTFADPLCSIYWNETRVRDKDSGLLNFNGINITYQKSVIYANGFPCQRIQTINEKLRGLEGGEGSYTSYYKYYKILNPECSKIIVNIKVAALGKIDRYKGTSQEPNDTYGEMLNESVNINIHLRPVYANHTKTDFELATNSTAKYHPDTAGTLPNGAMIIQGKLSTPYVRACHIEVPLEHYKSFANKEKTDFLGYEIRVTKQTVEPISPDVKNETYVDTIVEIIDDSIMAPNTFVVRSEYDAEFFSAIPERAYDMRLLKVRVPSNYNPITHSYTNDGIWDGQFSDEVAGPYGSAGLYWTDNPAWCFYDLITNPRYGLGRYLNTANFDKWTLYQIARYCDELVSDGFHGLEPRFTCNILIQSREDAFKVLNDMASIFRGLLYYFAGNLFAIQDGLKQPIFQFTNASVKDGDFKYSSTSAKVRHTVAVVRYNDKDDFYKPAVEYVEDVDGIRKYGIKEKSISAFGCTSRGQAIRMGRWVIASENLETETCSFTTGHEASMIRPGDVFVVSDSNRLMIRRSGRISKLDLANNTGSSPYFDIRLDGELKSLAANRDYTLTLSTPSFMFEPSQVTLVDSDDSQYIRNIHIQRFTIQLSDVTTVDGISTIRVTGNDTWNVVPSTSRTTNGPLDVTNFSTPDKFIWSVLSTEHDPDHGTIQEQIKHEQQFRALNIAEKEDGEYEVSSVEYVEAKYKEIDEAVKFINQVSFTVPQLDATAKLEIDGHYAIEDPDGVEYQNTRVIKYTITPPAPANRDGLSYFGVYASKTAFGAGVPDSKFLVHKEFATSDLVAQFVPASGGTWYFRMYAFNSLDQRSSAYKEDNITLPAIYPIRDIQIRSLRLTDNARTNEPAKSDPFPATYDQNVPSTWIDEYDGADTQISWETVIPTIVGANLQVSFEYKITIYKGNQTSTPLKVYDNYIPVDADLSSTTFEYTLADNYVSNGDDIYAIDRLYTVRVEAVDGNGDSSGVNTKGYDILVVDNPKPTRPPATDGFIDVNGHIICGNLNRPINATYAILVAWDKHFSYDEYVAGKIQASWVKDSVTGGGSWVANKANHSIGDHVYTSNNLYTVTSTGNSGTSSPTHTSGTNGIFTWFRSASFTPDVKQIAADVDVLELDASFKSEELKKAYVCIAYMDDFDVELVTLASPEFEDIPSFDIQKQLADRSSTASGCAAGVNGCAVEIVKVTPKLLDLIGEGWKAWVKIDKDGKWFASQRIKCVKDITSLADDYAGYIPFYCTRKMPMVSISQGANVGGGRVGRMIALTGSAQTKNYNVGCLYYLPPGTNQYPTNWYPETYTDQVETVGGHNAGDYNVYAENGTTLIESWPRGYRRFRVYFDEGFGRNPDKYWVMGQNVNNSTYYSPSLLNNLKKFFNPQNDTNGWDEAGTYSKNFVGGAIAALSIAQAANENKDVTIGGSSTYFNYHPAGFVQGHGGLQKTFYYFDIQMGHMVDNSYLEEAIFFVMSTDTSEKPAAGITDSGCKRDNETYYPYNYATTSTTSLAIPSSTPSTITLWVSVGLSYAIDHEVIIIHNSSHKMQGKVAAYNSGNGELLVTVTSTTGTGTFASWAVDLSS
jgi:hypothetical protein